MAVRRQAVISAMIPDMQDLATKYPRHVGMAQGVMRAVWSLVTTPETFRAARTLATLGLPPVSAIAAEVEELHRTGHVAAKWELIKQFSGVAIAVLMECNGYENTGRKRAVPHAAWNVGACFTFPTVPPTQQPVEDRTP
jgi:hypothetical protein